jgi:succinate-semialdehyde dehydrogenase / glutarate-semialdehyde dehydrogenase
MKVEVRNPRTGKNDFAFEESSFDQLQTQALAMRQAQNLWRKKSVEERIAAMQQWKQAVSDHKEELLAALSIDTGRYWETVLEVDLVASSIDRWCGIAKDFLVAAPQKKSSIPFLSLQQDLVPFSLVGVISPWNFPLLLSLIDTIPALLAGCAVLVKPSEVTPRFIEVMNKTIDAVPALQNILSYVSGTGETGANMVQLSDLICFTGSTATGKKVYAAASKKMIPVFLELGGKDPAVVLEGANIDLATSSILWGSCVNAGQSCLSIERVYLHANIYDAFVQQLVEKTKKIKTARVDMKAGQVGPIIFEKQAQIIDAQLTDALAKGASILCGNTQCELFDGGYYCAPTVVVNVTHDMLLLQEETFGPIMPVMKFETIEEGIALANGTLYGLSGAVFANTNEEALEIAKQIDGGAISINDCALTAVMHEGEKNSFKLSGIGGTRMGAAAIKRFMRQKVFIAKENQVASPWWWT